MDLKFPNDQSSSEFHLKINGITNEVWTFRDILENSSRMACVLHGAGIRRNDAIAILSENRHEFLAVALATLYLNAIIAPVNVTYTERKSGRPSVASLAILVNLECLIFFRLLR